jgi:tetratricopeptide (TPR) repeat protein
VQAGATRRGQSLFPRQCIVSAVAEAASVLPSDARTLRDREQRRADVTMKRTILVIAAGLLGTAPAFAADPFGTADSFRRFGWARCGAAMAEQMQGVCDPAPVDSTLEPKERAAAHLERAKALIALGRVPEAQKAATAAVEADPQSVTALTFRARVAHSLLQSGQAERDLNAALTIDPRNAAALANRAVSLLLNGKTAAALSDISEALAIAPNDVDALWVKARVYIALDQFDRAEEDLTRALAIEPDERRVRLFRAQLRLRRGQFDQAIEDATAIVTISPDSSALEVRAIARTALERRADAVEDLNLILGPPGEVVNVARDQLGLLLQRAILLSELGRRAEAAKDIDTLLRAGGKQAVLRAQVYLRQHGFPDSRWRAHGDI